jgi:hypothetical protein
LSFIRLSICLFVHHAVLPSAHVSACLPDRACSLWIADNNLRQLPANIGWLSELEAIGLSGNCLERLPVSLLKLPHLGAVWIHEAQRKPMPPFDLAEDDITGDQYLSCMYLPQRRAGSPGLGLESPPGSPGGRRVSSSSVTRRSITASLTEMPSIGTSPPTAAASVGGTPIREYNNSRLINRRSPGRAVSDTSLASSFETSPGGSTSAVPALSAVPSSTSDVFTIEPAQADAAPAAADAQLATPASPTGPGSPRRRSNRSLPQPGVMVSGGLAGVAEDAARTSSERTLSEASVGSSSLASAAAPVTSPRTGGHVDFAQDVVSERRASLTDAVHHALDDLAEIDAAGREAVEEAAESALRDRAHHAQVIKVEAQPVIREHSHEHDSHRHVHMAEPVDDNLPLEESSMSREIFDEVDLPDDDDVPVRHAAPWIFCGSCVCLCVYVCA